MCAVSQRETALVSAVHAVLCSGRSCNKLESNGLKPEMRKAFFCPSLYPVKYGYSGEQERGNVQIYGVVLKNSSPNTTAVCDRVKFKYKSCFLCQLSNQMWGYQTSDLTVTSNTLVLIAKIWHD